jgi:hypothetical protein
MGNSPSSGRKRHSFVAIPAIGTPGVVWTVLAAAITITNAVNLILKTGVAGKEIVSDDGQFPGVGSLPFDERLRRLE